jgi:hypothetical protein
MDVNVLDLAFGLSISVLVYGVLVKGMLGATPSPAWPGQSNCGDRVRGCGVAREIQRYRL